MNVPLVGPEMISNLIQTLIGPGNGIDVTVAANNNLGSANTTSQIGINSASNWQGINNLTMTGSTLTITGANNGLAVNGTTALSQATTFNTSGSAGLFLGGQITGNQSITKIGGQALFLTNTATGGGANSVSAWNIQAGTVEVRMSQGGSNPLGTTTPVTLNGATLNFKPDGDNLAAPQVLTDFAGNNLVNGSLGTMSSGNYISSANTTLDFRTLGGGAANKTVQIGSVAMGGPLGGNFLIQSAANNYTLEITGGLSMIKDAYLALNNTDTTIDGTISGNGTLFKQGGGALNINTTANTATGGTVVAAGSLYFGSFQGNTRALNPTSQLAVGNITVQPGAAIRFTGVGNVNGGQLVDVRSHLNTYGVIGIADDSALSSYHLRVPLAGGAFNPSMQTAATTGAGVLAINSVYKTNAIDIGKIGDGTWYVGSTTNGSFQQGSYNAGTLGAGKSYNFGTANPRNSDSVVRLGAGGSTLYVGSDFTDNALTDVTFGTATKTSLVVGAPLTSSFAGTIGNGTGTVILIGDQDYTGTTLVNRGSTLEIRGTANSTSYETFSFLNVGGPGGRFFDGATPIQPVIHQGGEIGLRNDFDLLANGISAQGRYGDATPVSLNSGILRLVGSNAADIQEKVGTVNIAGGSFLIANRNTGGRITEMNVAGITRSAQGQVSIQSVTSQILGADERITVAGANLAAQIANIPGGITNGMVAPWMYHQTDMQFLTYSDFGFVIAGFDRSLGAGALVTNPNLTPGTERLFFNGAQTIAATTTVNTYAVRADASITGTNAETVNIVSGGLLTNAATTITVATATTGELIIANANNIIFGDATNTALDSAGTGTGKITATSISKSGDGNMFMDVDHTSFTGPIALNRGGLFLREIAAGSSNNGGNGNTITINGANTTLGLRSDVSGTIFNNHVVIAAGNPLVNINTDRVLSTSATGTTVQLGGNITFGGAPGDQGQILNMTTGNTFALQVNGTVDLGPVGNAVVTANAGTNLTFGGTASIKTLTGSGTLIKQGGNTLFLGVSGVLPTTAASDNTGGIILQNGTLQANAGAQAGVLTTPNNITLSQLGSGDLTLVAGTLNLRLDGDNNGTNRTYIYNTIPNVNVVGSATIGLDRITSSGGSNKTLAFPNLNIGGQTLTNGVSNTFSLRFNATSLSGTPTFAVNNDPGLILSGVSDGGAGLYIVKQGGAQMWFDDRITGAATPNAVNTFTGGIFVNQGTLRFGNVLAASTLATAGTSQIQINPQGAIRLEAGTNIDTGGGQTVLAIGAMPQFAVVRALAANTPTQLAALINPASTNSTLRIEATYAAPLSLGSLGDGSLYLGSQGTISYTANSLVAGNGNTYRLGANDSATNRLDLSPVSGVSNVLTGANRLLVGALAVGGTGTVLLNNDNSYTGGTTVSRGSSLLIRSGVTLGDTPLGSGTVDVFGVLGAISANGQFRNPAGTPGDLLGANNANTYVFHPGSTLSLDGNNITTGNNANRWADAAPIALNGSSIFYQSLTGTNINETVGAITFEKGSRIGIINPGGPGGAHILTAASLARVGTGTMVFVPGDPFGTNAGNSDNFVTTAALPATVGGGVNMLPAYIVNGFISAAGQSFLTDGGSNRLINTTYTSTNFASSTNTSIVDVTANTTLAGDVSAFAFRTGAFTISNATGQFNTITLNQAGVGGGGILAYAAAVINPNLNFNNKEALIFNQAGLTLNGDISGVSSAGITKFGAGALTIGKDQSDAARGTGNGYSNGWTVNEGSLAVGIFGALGNATPTNTVSLHANATGTPTLTLTANQGNQLNEFYSMGNVLVTDNAAITMTTGATDRTQSLGAAGAFSNVIVTSTGGSLHDAQLAVTIGNTRNILQVGDVSAVGTNASVILNVAQTVINNNTTSGSGNGLTIASLTGSADQTFKKWGNAELYIRGASTFAGTVSIEQGAVGVFHTASLGATSTVNVKRFGTLDISAAGFAKAVTYELGGIERWSVSGARTGTLNLGAGTLQINNDQSGPAVTVTMNGGSIEGFLKVDDQLIAANATQAVVYRTLGSNVSFNLAGDSFLGQNINQGMNGFDNGVQANPFSPFGNTARGVILEIKGAISGVGGLTKQGYDVVTLSGPNTYSGGTTLLQGMLRAGADNVLGSSDNTVGNIGKSNLSTTGASVFDLNGYNQSVGRLTSPSTGLTAATTNLTGSGYVTNSSTEIKTLTVGNGAPLDAIYGGVIQYNVNLTKTGPNKQTLTNINTYVGATNVTGGTLEITHATAGVIDGISGTSSLTVGNGATFNMRTGVNANETLTLGAYSGTALTLTGTNRIGMEVGTGTFSSQLVLHTGAVALHTGTTAIDVYGITGSAPSGTATVISAPSGGLTAGGGTYALGNVYNNTNFTVSSVSQTDTLVQVTTAAEAELSSAFWKGGFAGNTDVWAVSNGNTASNWATDLAGTDTGLIPGSSTNVFLSVTSPTNQNNMQLGDNMSISTLTLNSTSGTPVVLQSTGGFTLTIGGAAAITTDVGSGTATLNSKIVLGNAAPVILVNSANELTLAGQISGAATSLTKSGTGTLSLGASNAHGGTTLITGGILSISHGDALGAAAASGATGTVVSPGASLEMSNNIAVDPNELLTISGTGSATNGALRNLSGNNIYGGLLTLGTVATTIQSDAGLLTLSNPGTLGGASAVALTVTGTGNTTISSIIGTAAGTLTKTGTGLLTLHGANAYVGATNVNVGTVSITNALGLGTTAGNTTVALGASLNLASVASAEPLNINGAGDTTPANAAFNGGALTGIGFSTQSATVTLAGNSTIKSISGLLTLSNAASIAAGTFGTTVDGAGDTTISGTVVGTTAASTFTKAGNGLLTFSGTAANTYAGLTTVQGGTLVLAKTAGINAVPGNLTIGDGTGNDVVRLTNSNQIADTGVVSFNGVAANAGILRLNNQSETLAGLSSTGGAGIVENESGSASTSTLTVNVASGTQTFSGVIRNGDAVGVDGTVALVKIGAGTQELSGASTHTGGTSVNAGTLVVSGSLAGDVNVAPGAILASGNNLSSEVAAITASSTTVLSSIVDPGGSGGSGLTTIGRLNADGDVTLGTSPTELSTLRIEIAGNTAGTEYDQLNVLGATRSVSLTHANLTGGAVNGHTFTNPTYGAGQFLTDGAKYFVLTLADNGSTLGGTEFANTLAPDSNLTTFDSIVIGGQLFAISYQANFSDGNNATNFTGGNDVALMAIPEPNSLAMLAGSLGLALGLQRFRRRARVSEVA